MTEKLADLSTAENYDHSDDDTLVEQQPGIGRVVHAEFRGDWVLYVVWDREGFHGRGRWHGRELVKTEPFADRDEAIGLVRKLADRADIGNPFNGGAR